MDSILERRGGTGRDNPPEMVENIDTVRAQGAPATPGRSRVGCPSSSGLTFTQNNILNNARLCVWSSAWPAASQRQTKPQPHCSISTRIYQTPL